MHNPQRLGGDSFVIQVRAIGVAEEQQYYQPQHHKNIPSSKNNSNFNFSAMKLFHRFRKVLMRLVFSVPSSSSSSRRSTSSSSDSARHRNSERFEPPKTSCSSYYSSYSHYNEAISDCIEFFNKSAQDDIISDDRKSDIV